MRDRRRPLRSMRSTVAHCVPRKIALFAGERSRLERWNAVEHQTPTFLALSHEESFARTCVPLRSSVPADRWPRHRHRVATSAVSSALHTNGGSGDAAEPRSRRASRQLANLRNAPPAPVGNRRRLVHGAYGAVAAERLDAKARELFAALAEDAPVRADDGGLPSHDAVAVRMLADALCRLDSIAEYLGTAGLEDEHGRPGRCSTTRLGYEAMRST